MNPPSNPSPEFPTSNPLASSAPAHPSGGGLLSPQSARHSKLSEQTPAAPGPDHDGTTIRPARVGPGVTGDSLPTVIEGGGRVSRPSDLSRRPISRARWFAIAHGYKRPKRTGAYWRAAMTK